MPGSVENRLSGCLLLSRRRADSPQPTRIGCRGWPGELIPLWGRFCLERFNNLAYGCRSSRVTMHLKAYSRRVLYVLCWLTAMPLGSSLGQVATIKSVQGIDSVTQAEHTEVIIYLSGPVQFRPARDRKSVV